MKVLKALCAAIGLIGLSTASLAATFSGTLPPGGSVYNLPVFGAGTISVTVEFSRAVSGALYGRVLNSYNDYCGPDLDYCGGNDDEQYVEFGRVTDRKFTQRLITRGNYVYRAPGFVEYGYEGLEGIEAAFDDDLTTSLGYVATVAVVPEPAGWALMIAGFGFAGAALRRRGSAGRGLHATT